MKTFGRRRTLLEDDRISGLPYDVLSKILSLLTMKEAVQTCILSRSWKDLWKAYSGLLDFDAPDSLIISPTQLDLRLLFEATCRYTLWVDKLLDSHQSGSGTIQGLRIVFMMNKKFSHHIDRWIQFALSNNVESLVLDLAPPCRRPSPSINDFYVFPAPVGFHRLTSLELRFVSLPEQVTQSLFRNCRLLQRLCLEEIPDIKNFLLDDSLPDLKHLEITKCRELENVYVSATRLTSFQYVSYIDYETTVAFGDVAQLSILVLGGTHYKVVLDNLPFNLSQLDSVSVLDSVSLFYNPIHDCLWPCISSNGTLGRFHELKQLGLNIVRCLGERIQGPGAFLQACTCLEKLVLTLTWMNPDHRKAQAQARARAHYRDLALVGDGQRQRLLEHVPMGFEHKCLKEVVYVGWLGLDAEVEIVQVLIESARSSLERITINLALSHTNKDATKLVTRSEMDNAKARAMQLQQKLVSSNATLLVN